MKSRRQPPVLSPVPVRALTSAAAAALGVGGANNLAGELATRLGARHVMLLDSGTSALRRAIELAARGRIDGVVAVPAWSCYDIVSAAAGAGVPFVFYDVDPVSLQPTGAGLAFAARRKATAIVLVHGYGVPVDVAAVRRQLSPDTLIIEDAAQGWGGSMAGRVLGGLGDYGVLSFGRGKGITGGGGGALALISARATGGAAGINGRRGWREFQVAAAMALLSRPSMFGLVASVPWLRLGQTIYKPPREPRAMAAASAALIHGSIPAGDREGLARRTNAARLRAAVGRSSLTNIVVPAGAEPAWLRLPVAADNAAHRDRILAAGQHLGVAPSYPRDLPALAASLGLPAPAPAIPGATRLVETLITLPVHGGLADSDLAALERLIA